jgi:DNA-binding NtrC family response regulator
VIDRDLKQEEGLSCRPPAVVYAVGDPQVMDCLGFFLAAKQLAYRTFTDWRVALEAFASACPRPAVLVTGCLDLAGSGLILIQKCKEAHPRIKVVLWSGYLETTISDLLAHTRVVPDAQFAKGGQDDMGEMVETIAELARDAEVASAAHSAGNE